MVRTGAADGFNVLVAGAFADAVHFRFGTDFTLAEVIRAVAREHTGSEDAENDFDPYVAERLILAVLDNGSVEGLGEEATARAQFALLVGLVGDRNLDDAGMNEFLASSRSLADIMIARA